MLYKICHTVEQIYLLSPLVPPSHFFMTTDHLAGLESISSLQEYKIPLAPSQFTCISLQKHMKWTLIIRVPPTTC